METKTDKLLGMMRDGDWPGALSLAKTFRLLGDQRDTIHRAHDARVHPGFYRQIGKDPDALVSAGIGALQRLYAGRI